MVFTVLKEKIAVKTAIFSCAYYQQQKVFRASHGFPAAATTITAICYACSFKTGQNQAEAIFQARTTCIPGAYQGFLPGSLTMKNHEIKGGSQ
jgi:hypothetical protein